MKINFTKNHYLWLLCLFMFSYNAYAQTAESIARQYIADNKAEFNLTEEDISELIVTDQYVSQKSGITHIYFTQARGGIQVFNAIINVNVANNRVLNMGSRAVSDLSGSIKSSSASISAQQAVEAAAQHLSLSLIDPLVILESDSDDPSQSVLFSDGGISLEPIPARLLYQPMEDGSVRLAWDLSIYTLDAEDWWQIRVDAASGEVLDKNNWVSKCNFASHADEGVHYHGESSNNNDAPKVIEIASSGITTTESSVFSSQYRVFPEPVESPSHGVRELISGETVIDKTASPYGWHDIDGISGHDFNIGRGNNVHAYYDGNNLNGPAPTLDPANGGLDDAKGTNHVFDFPANLDEDDPLLYRDAAITNLFYWNNLIHDVFYNYGFDEASGNFQENNYEYGGLASDYVYAEAQDGSGANNANFATPPDGRNPRMQMFLWTGNPRRDGDFDNGVIVHEYGHGISIRLTGGPSTSSCLGNEEQMGEGWSDWFALMLTQKSGDSGPDRRGIGTYVLYEGTDGDGIRPSPYSTDMAINNFTYKDIAGLRAPHGVGFVWATMLWEVTWKLIDAHGFDPDLHNGTGGNNMALELVTLALKLQPCSPGFIDGRDAILQADSILYGGANYELIWEAFAKRGLGYSADQGSSADKRDGTEAYDLPTIGLLLAADKESVGTGGSITYTLSAINRSFDPITNVVITNPLPEGTTFVSASDGGELVNGVVTFPPVDLAIGGSVSRTFKVKVNDSPYTTTIMLDNIEDSVSNATNWTRAGTAHNIWMEDSTNTFSGNKAWFVKDEETITDQYLIRSFDLGSTENNHLSFWHEYDTEANYDGGVVEISFDGGATYEDLGNLMVKNSYNSAIDGPLLGVAPYGPIPGRRAFSGQSLDYLNTIVDLSDYNGQTVTIRWRLGTDVMVGGIGWWIDDVGILDVTSIKNAANVTCDQGYTATADLGRLGTIVFESEIDETVYLSSLDAVGKENHIEISWFTAAESNNSGFEIQRRTSNSSYEALEWIDTKGESRSDVKYKYKDREVVISTVYYYRLKQVDIYGNETFSQEVTAVLGEKNKDSDETARTTDSNPDAEEFSFNVYPNPVQDNLIISIQNSNENEFTIQVLDLQGRQVIHRQISGSGSDVIGIRVNHLDEGIYLLRVMGNNLTQTRKIKVNQH